MKKASSQGKGRKLLVYQHQLKRISASAKEKKIIFGISICAQYFELTEQVAEKSRAYNINSIMMLNKYQAKCQKQKSIPSGLRTPLPEASCQYTTVATP